VLVVDRYAAYKAMSWVKDGVLVLAFCWSHVRRDFIRVGNSTAESIWHPPGAHANLKGST
jgi:hypothetical protein